jgi:hypothetical protein
VKEICGALVFLRHEEEFQIFQPPELFHPLQVIAPNLRSGLVAANLSSGTMSRLTVIDGGVRGIRINC